MLWSAIIGSPCSERVSVSTVLANFVTKPPWTMALPRGIIAKDHNLLSLGETLAMTRCTQWLRSFLSCVCLLFTLVGDVGRFLFLCLCPSPALAAEILFLRKQLAPMQRAAALLSHLSEPRTSSDAEPEGTTVPSPRFSTQHDSSVASKQALCSHALRVASIYPETPSVKTFRLVDPAGGAIPFQFLPGQFLRLAIETDGKRVKRAYTIASTPTRNSYIEITVKREEQGLVCFFSTRVCHYPQESFRAFTPA